VLGTLAALTEQLAHDRLPRDVVAWASPVPYFGEISRARVATVGINPSNLEFVDGSGRALVGKTRRLETLASLELAAWGDADGHTVRALAKACNRYFGANPYRRWFDVLERVLAVSDHSYYGGNRLAAHLDLVPYATDKKWGLLSPLIKRILIARGRSALAEVIASSQLDLLVLNGRSVVDAFIASTGSALTPVEVPHLSLPRKDGKWVTGIRWEGTISRISDHDLGREIAVVGFNHNLQSSFGVTTSVMRGIGEEVGNSIG
jgi:hypothetical protein